ncbi:MAG: PTS sugar transporter subunit IIA [Fusobacteriaceae bacterium]
MKSILENNICIVESVKDWREAVKKSGEILLKNGVIEERYIDAAIKNIETLGNYIVLTDNVAMPHARPEDGVKETGLSLLVIKEGVDFSDEKVYLVFMLASKDSNSHIEIIKKLSNLIDDEELISKLMEVKNEIEVLNLI